MAHRAKFGIQALALGAILAVTIPLTVSAAEDKTAIRKYPPYPDVWGRELPFPNLGNEYYGIDQKAYEQADGTIAILIYSIPRRKSGNPIIGKFQMLDFFTGTLRIPNQTRGWRLEKSGTHKKLKGPWGKYPADRWRSWKFTGKGGAEFQIERYLNMGLSCPSLTRDTYDHYYILRDSTGAVIGKRMLLGLFDRPVRTGIWKWCEQSKIQTHFMSRWRDISGAISRLDGGTMLIHGNFPFVIRINKDFTSPFITTSDKLFRVDRAVLEGLQEKAHRRPGLPLQNEDDAIYDYLMKLRKEKPDAK